MDYGLHAHQVRIMHLAEVNVDYGLHACQVRFMH